MVGRSRLDIVLQHHNRLVRETLATCMTREPGIALVGTAASGPELLELCDTRRPTVVVFEADATKWSNERLVSLLLAPGPHLRMVGMHEALPSAHIIRAYRAGISALVAYSSGLDALVTAVKAPSVAVEATRAELGATRMLTDRELEVLYLISAGYAPRQIAFELGISVHTVENHKHRIFAKLDVHNQAHAAESARRLGLLSQLTGQDHDYGGRPSRTCVAVRNSAGRIGDHVLEVLGENRIPVVDGNGVEADPDFGETPVTVLIDPAEEDWHEPARRPGGFVVVASGELPPDDTVRALAVGAAILPASRVGTLLVPAIRAARHGYLVVNAAHSRGLLGDIRGALGGGRNWHLALTPREREILLSIGRGHSSKQTARLLGISVRTVENLQSNLFRKLGVHSKAAALSAAHELGLLDELPGSG
jgi:DNA-binding NarL/FixJ family response regulator